MSSSLTECTRAKKPLLLSEVLNVKKPETNKKQQTDPLMNLQKFHPFQKHSPRIQNKIQKTITPNENGTRARRITIHNHPEH